MCIFVTNIQYCILPKIFIAARCAEYRSKEFMNHIIAINLWPSFNFSNESFFLPSQRPVVRVLSWSCSLLFTAHFLFTVPSAFSFHCCMWCRRLQPSALQRHCAENSKQIFSEMKLHDLVPDSYIHVSVSDLYIPTIGQIHECGHWQRGRAVTFLGIHISDLVCSVHNT